MSGIDSQNRQGGAALLARWRRILGANQQHHEHEANCTSLCCGQSGQRLSVLCIANESHEAARLRDLGLREGAMVTVLQDGDPLLVRIGDARFGISRRAAMLLLCAVE